MVDIYYKLVKEGKRTLDSVLDKYKIEVKNMLHERNN